MRLPKSSYEKPVVIFTDRAPPDERRTTPPISVAENPKYSLASSVRPLMPLLIGLFVIFGYGIYSVANINIRSNNRSQRLARAK
jgi:hypothetical protein